MLVHVIRKRYDATARRHQLDGALVKAVSRPPEKRDKAGEVAMRQERSTLDKMIKQSDTRLAVAFPKFAELSSPKPLAMAAGHGG
jgi:hypothetical protein